MTRRQRPRVLSNYVEIKWTSGSVKFTTIYKLTGNLSLRHRVQTVSGAHSASYSTGTRSRGVKLIARLHLVPRSRMRGAIHPLHLYAFKTWCSIKKSTGTLPLPLVHCLKGEKRALSLVLYYFFFKSSLQVYTGRRHFEVLAVYFWEGLESRPTWTCCPARIYGYTTC